MKKQKPSARGVWLMVVVWVTFMGFVSNSASCLPSGCGPWHLFLFGAIGAGAILIAMAAVMVAVIFFPSLQEDQDQ